MRHQRVNYVLVSAFTLTMLGAAVTAIVKFGGSGGATNAYYLVLDNVADIKFGTQVRYEGFPIGQIEEISPFEDGGRMRFRIDLSVTEGWKVPTDSIARIGASNLLSAKTVDIGAGTSGAMIAHGAQIRAAQPVDMFSVIASVASQVGDLSQSSLKPTLEDFRVLMGSLTGTASTIKGRAQEITDNIAAVTNRLDRSSKGLERLMSDGNVATIEDTLANLNSTSRNFKTTSAALKATRGEVDALLADITAMVRDNRGNVDGSLTNVQYTLRAVATMIDSVMVNVDATSRNMSEFSRLIRQNPGLLLSNSQPAPIGHNRRQPSRLPN